MTVEQLATFPSAKVLQGNGTAWVHFEQFGPDEASFFRTEGKFHPLDIKDCLSLTQRPKIDIYNNYLFLVLHFPDYNNETRKLETIEISFFLTREFVISVQKQKSKALRQFFYRTKTNDKLCKEIFSGTSGLVLYRILDHLYHQTPVVMDRLTQYTKEVEEEIYTEEQSSNPIRHLVRLRRNILRFQRMVDPQRFVINTLVHLRRPYFGEELSVYFDDIHDRIEESWAHIGSTKEIIDGLYAVNESLVTQRTNETIKVLTTISVLLMPPTLIASMYGMNLHLPFGDTKHSFWIVFAFMAVLVGCVLFFLKRRKVL